MSVQFTTHDNLYHITSHGNGWAYEVTCNSTKANLWFQDQDACQLQNDTQDFTNTDVLRSYFECLCE
jgi:hypothetical protein